MTALRIFTFVVTLTVFSFGLLSPAAAQEGDLDLATQTSNPMGGDFMIVLNQIDMIWTEGPLVDNNPAAPDTTTINTYVIQPVISAPMDNVIAENWGLVFRPTFQFFFDTDLPNATALGFGGVPPVFPPPPFAGIPFSSEGGFGDFSFFSLIGPSTPTTLGGGGVIVSSFGLSASFPTGVNAFTSDKYSLGPAWALAYLGKPGVIGMLGQQFWDIGDDLNNGTANDVNQMLMQVFYYYNVAPGWQIGGAPLMVLDWENDNYEIPLNMGVSYTGIIIDGLPPFKLGLEAYTYVENSDIFGNDWGIRILIAPILPSPIKKLFPSLYE